MTKALTLALAIGLCVSGVAGKACAETTPGAPTGPSAEMKKLTFLVGSTTGIGKMYMPNQEAMEWTMSDTSTWTPGGQYLKSESRVSYKGFGTDDSLTMMAYDQQAKVYRMWRYSSMATLPIEAAGNFEGNKLVLITKPTDTGQVFRATFEPKAKGEVSFLLEMKQGDKYEKLQEGIFTSKS